VLGAVIGNAAGMFMYGIAQDSLAKREQKLISDFNDGMAVLNAKLDEQYRQFIELLQREFAKFKSMVALAFDPDVNLSFLASIALAQFVGCDDSRILKNKEEVDAFFLNE
jgi:hypothetical protein